MCGRSGTREEHRADREVLARRPGGYLGELHAPILLESPHADRRPSPGRVARPLRRRDRQGVAQRSGTATRSSSRASRSIASCSPRLPSRRTRRERRTSTSSRPTRSSRARGSCTAATTRSARSRRGTARRLRELTGPTRRVGVHHRRRRGGLSRRHPPRADRDRLPAVREADRVRPARAAQHGVALVDRRAGRPTTGRARSTRTSRSAKAKRKLAKDLLNFCRLTDADGAGTSGWTKHLKTLDAPRREADEARPHRPRAARPRHGARHRPQPRHPLARRAGDDEDGRRHRPEHADGGSLHEPGGAARRAARSAARSRSRSAAASSRACAASSPAAGSCGSTPTPTPTATSSPRTSTPTQGGRRLGEVALVDATSRIGQRAAHLLQHAARRERRRAHRVRQRLRQHPHGNARPRRQPLGDAPRRDDRQPEARSHGHRPARQADPAHPRRPLADLARECCALARWGNGTPAGKSAVFPASVRRPRCRSRRAPEPADTSRSVEPWASGRLRREQSLAQPRPPPRPVDYELRLRSGGAGRAELACAMAPFGHLPPIGESACLKLTS